MDFELNRETRMILDAVRNWIARECPEESVREWDEAGGHPEKIWNKFLALGFTTLSVPESYGGEGPDYLGSVLVTETLASRYPALARRYGSITFFGGAAFSEMGNEAQKRKFLPAFLEGQQAATVFALQSDNTNGAATAFLPLASGENGPVLSGSGRCVGPSNAGDMMLVPALSGDSENGQINVYCIETNRAGVQIANDETLGYQGNTGAQVSFDNTQVSPEDMLGETGKDACLRLFGLVHLELGAEALGIARGSFEYAVKYATQRIQFGRPIARFPAIRDMLVQIDCDIEATALLLYRAAAAADSGKAWIGGAARAYYAACRIARHAALDGLQILGGYGYTMEFAAQRYVRDAISLYNTGAESEGLKRVLSEQMGI